MADSRPITYWDYIRVPDLLALQGGVENDEEGLSQDEVLFITVHQVVELWFKLILGNLAAARDLFALPHVPDDKLAGASRRLDRIATILHVAADHWRVVETLTPRDFLDFRDKLFPASGGQSPQFREIEILMGLPDEARLPYVSDGDYREALREPDGSDGWAAGRVDDRKADTPTFKDAVEDWLFRTPINGSTPDSDGDGGVVDSFLDEFLVRHSEGSCAQADHAAALAGGGEAEVRLRERYAAAADQAAAYLRAADVEQDERDRRRRIRAAVVYIETYRDLPLLAWPRAILDGIVAVEQRFVIFRQRHARMVERIIGRRVGTGGSTGVDYLDETALRYRVFSDLWAARTLLLPSEQAPDPSGTDVYEFRYEG